MNSSADLLTRLKNLGATLSLDGDKLVVKGPQNSIDQELRQAILEQKDELVAVLKAALRQKSAAALPRGSARAQLSSAQRRIWFLTRLDPESTVWNISSLVEIRGSLNRSALRSTFDELVSRHRILRGSCKVLEGLPHLHFAEAARGTLEVLEATLPSEARAKAQEIASAPFDLESGGLFRAVLFVLSDTHHFLLVAGHHIILDGWSLGRLSREVALLYAAFAHGAEPPLQPPVDFEDYVAWEQEQEELSSASDLAWWLHKLQAPLPLLELPSDRSRGGAASSKGERISLQLHIATAERLNVLAAANGVTPFVLLLAAFKVLLYRYTGLTDVLVGTVSSYRRRSEFETVIGMFANPIVLRTDLSGSLRFDELLLRVRDTVRDGFAHSNLPFDHLVEHLHPERDGEHTPLFQVAFAYQNLPLMQMSLAALEVLPQSLDFSASRYDLSVEIWKTPSGLQVDFEFSTALFDRSTMQRMQQHYLCLLDGILENPSELIHRLELLSDREKHQLAVEWNGHRSDYPLDPIHMLVERRCSEMPDEAALIDGERVITGRELSSLSNAVAIHLLTMGAAAGIPIAVILPRSLASVIAMLAILKTGGIYIPLDPEDPDERVNYMLKDSGARLAITNTEYIQRINELAVGISLLDISTYLISPRQAEADVLQTVSRDDLMCILYTSGSTGQPKGVEIPHRSVARLLFSKECRSFGERESILHMGPDNFDISLLEIWGPLVHGGRCIIYPDRQPEGTALRELCKKHGITTAWFTTSIFNWLVTDSPEVLRILRKVYVGGEALSVPHIRKAQTLFPGIEIFNGYGPTEGTTFTCIHAIPSQPPMDLPSIPIGRPISNTLVYILDPNRQLVPVGVPGELYIGGDGLARGYRSRAELTSERFLANPISGRGVLYRSGDLATYLADGTIRFLGRADQQVKIRGHRIEIGEIEAAMAAVPGITASVVTVHATTGRGDLLVGRFTATHSLSLHELRSSLKKTQPAYMVPNLFEQLATLPFLSSGKVDRSALASLPLPKPIQDDIVTTDADDDAPLLIAQAMAELLDLNAVGVDEDFFDLGGHSLLAVQLAARLEELFERKVQVALLFQASTPRAVAQQLNHDATHDANQNSGVPARHIVPLQPHGEKPPLFFTHLSDGKIHYYLSLVRSLGKDQPAYGIGRADPELIREMIRDDRLLSLYEISEFHLRELKRIRPSGPYVLCGYSSGGALAYEMARRLADQGEAVRLILLDSFAPPPLHELLRFTRIKLVRTDLIPVMLRFTLGKGRRFARELRRRLRRSAGQASHSATNDLDRLNALLDRAQMKYKPKPYNGDVLLIHAEDDELHTLLKVEESHYWDRHVLGEISVIRLPGNHGQIMEMPTVARLSTLLQRALADWDKANS